MSPHSAPTSTDCYRQRPRKHSISEPAFRSGRAASGSRSRTIPAQSARLIAPRDTHAPGLGTKRELGRFSWWGKGFVDHVFNNRALMVRTLVQNAAERGTPRNQAQPGLWPEGAQLPGRSRASRLSSATRKRQGLRAHAPPQKDLRADSTGAAPAAFAADRIRTGDVQLGKTYLHSPSVSVRLINQRVTKHR